MNGYEMFLVILLPRGEVPDRTLASGCSVQDAPVGQKSSFFR